MAKHRRNAQIGLIAAVILLAGCLGVLFFQPAQTRAESDATQESPKVETRQVSSAADAIK